MADTRTLSDSNRKAFLLDLHKMIEETAKTTAASIIDGTIPENLGYPPNCGLSKDEATAVSNLTKVPNIESALRKIIADAAAQPVFQALCLLDGVADLEDNSWTGICIVDMENAKENEGVFLHDEFMDLYWKWREIRPEKDWCLDTLDE